MPRPRGLGGRCSYLSGEKMGKKSLSEILSHIRSVGPLEAPLVPRRSAASLRASAFARFLAERTLRSAIWKTSFGVSKTLPRQAPRILGRNLKATAQIQYSICCAFRSRPSAFRRRQNRSNPLNSSPDRNRERRKNWRVLPGFRSVQSARAL